MNWKKIYNSRLATAREAVSRIRSGNRIVVGHATGSPETLLKAMVDNRESYGYENVELVHMVSMGPSEYCLPNCAKHFVHNSFFAGATSRTAIDQGRAEFTPCHFSQIPRLFKEGVLPVDVCLCMLSPPDEHGFCSFGVSVDYTKPAAESARLVIAQVSPHMPRTLGDTFIHVSKIDHIVECDDKPIVLPPPKIGAIDEAIGGHCAELIRDGDVLQLGIGALPDAILGFLKDKRDLGIHTGTGGQVDFVRGAAFSKGGRSILAFTSTAAKGTVSKIVPVIDMGACVTTLRADVHFIVTEYGVADLRGKTVSQRAKALIGIAHPDFRNQLKSEYKKRFGRDF